MFFQERFLKPKPTVKQLTMKKLFGTFGFIFFYFILFASNTKTENTKPDGTILYEKVYLHVDRELYSPGDNIWFKAYLVSGINNKLIPGYKNIYVQLISDSGRVVFNRLLLSIDGVSNGDFYIPNEIAEGKYKIRAYTKYLENFGDESFFYKNIHIASAKNTSDNYLEIKKETTEKKFEISFLPEGGSFIVNAINHVAFKAINEKGEGIDIKGKIIDNLGNEIVPFQSIYKGMGKFIIMPQEGTSYFADIDNQPGLNIELPVATNSGVSLHFEADGNYLQFTITRNLKTQGTQKYLLQATHKGIELFNSDIEMKDFQHGQRLFKGLFPLGISKVKIIDNQNQTLAERLVFVRNNEKNIQLKLNKNEFKRREKVEINISSLLPESDTIKSTLSVAVVHEDYFNANGNTQNMESYLLIDSELRGSLETPASLFEDDETLSSEKKLDLVMMVNGWRSYYWDDLGDKARQELPGWADIGLTLKGKVVSLWGEKPVDFGTVVLGPFSKNFLFEEDTTDFMGRFSFDKLYLKDSAKIMINSKTRRGLRKTIPTLEPQNIFNSLVNKYAIQQICPDVEIPLKFYRDDYNRRLAEQEFQLVSGTILLKDVDISAPRLLNGDGHYRLYGEPDVSLQITDDDRHFSSVQDFLEGRVAGVLVMGDQVQIRGSSKPPLLVVDGLETSWERLIDIPMGDIDKIEILKSAFSSAVYGSRGGDGVISILTNMGKGDWEYEFVRNVRGRITPRVRGFQQARQFYSPSYTLENKNNPKPDYRPTLFWDPNIALEARNGKIEFYTGDNFARYKIIFEGLSKNGKICTATGNFAVSVQ